MKKLNKKVNNFAQFWSNFRIFEFKFLRVLLHRQKEINAKKIITIAPTVAILPYGVWF